MCALVPVINTFKDATGMKEPQSQQTSFKESFFGLTVLQDVDPEEGHRGLACVSELHSAMLSSLKVKA